MTDLSGVVIVYVTVAGPVIQSDVDPILAAVADAFPDGNYWWDFRPNRYQRAAIAFAKDNPEPEEIS